MLVHRDADRPSGGEQQPERQDRTQIGERGQGRRDRAGETDPNAMIAGRIGAARRPGTTRTLAAQRPSSRTDRTTSLTKPQQRRGGSARRDPTRQQQRPDHRCEPGRRQRPRIDPHTRAAATAALFALVFLAYGVGRALEGWANLPSRLALSIVGDVVGTGPRHRRQTTPAATAAGLPHPGGVPDPRSRPGQLAGPPRRLTATAAARCKPATLATAGGKGPAAHVGVRHRRLGEPPLTHATRCAVRPGIAATAYRRAARRYSHSAPPDCLECPSGCACGGVEMVESGRFT